MLSARDTEPVFLGVRPSTRRTGRGASTKPSQTPACPLPKPPSPTTEPDYQEGCGERRIEIPSSSLSSFICTLPQNLFS